jgi:two-component system chemotaxis sensor kinase CheA
VYDTLTDVAGLRFPEPVAAPCPSPKPLADTPASAGIDFPREGELKNSEAILAAGIPAELGLPETVEVSTRILDELLEIVGELTLTRARVNALAQGERMQPLQDEARRMGALLRKLDEGVMNARLLPFSLIAGRLRRFVREQAEVLGKEVQLTVSGERIGLDKAVMLRLSGALVHLLRNALDHGMETAAERSASGKRETGSITISLNRERNALRLRVADDGRGIDTDAVLARAVERGLTSAEDASTLPRDRIFEFLFAPGFSTRKEVGALSGRGVGLDAVRTEIMRMGGSVAVNAESGRGTEFLIELPVSPAVAPVLLVEVEGLPLAFPVHSVLRTYEAMRSDLRKDASGKFVFLHDKQEYPLRTLASQIGVEARLDPKRFAVVAVGFGEKVGCWAVDRLLREEEVFVKPFRGPWARLRGVTGYSLLGDGRLVYLLEPAELTAV